MFRMASRQFESLNHGAENNKNLKIIIDDARNFLNKTDDKYDTIVTDVTNMKYKSNPYLYTTDYFQIMKDKLTDQGVAAAWVPLSGLSFHDLQVLIASFNYIFPHTTVWYYAKEPATFLLLVGTPQQLVVDMENIKKTYDSVSEDLQKIFIDNEYDLAAMLLLGEKDVDDLTQGIDLNTDDRPVLESQLQSIL